MRNQYPGHCLVCGAAVAAGAGWFQQNYQRKRPPGGKRGSGQYVPTVPAAGKWLLRCLDCKGKGNKPDQQH